VTDRLLRLVFDLKREADAFKAKGDTARLERLEQGMAAFLDEIAKAGDLTADVRLFLAQAYAGLGQHAKAAALYKDYPTPAAGDGEAAKKYQGVQVLLMRELRLAKAYEQSLAVLNEALKGWGRANLDVQREKVLLLEDAGNLPAAHRACREMQDALKKAWTEYELAGREERAAEEAERSAKTDAERQQAQERRAAAQAKREAAQPLRDAYWEFYFYELRIVLKNDLKRAKDDADRERRLGVLAQAIKKLEDAQEDFGGRDLKQKYHEMVEGEPLLKKKYVEAQGKRLLSAEAEKSQQ